MNYDEFTKTIDGEFEKYWIAKMKLTKDEWAKKYEKLHGRSCLACSRGFQRGVCQKEHKECLENKGLNRPDWDFVLNHNTISAIVNTNSYGHRAEEELICTKIETE